VTIQEPTQLTSCCNLLAPVRQLSFNSRSARMSFSQVQRVFIVENYLASRSYLTCQNEFKDTFPDSPAPNKSTVYCLANRFQSLQKLLHQTWMHRWTRWTFQLLNITLVFVFWSQCNLFFDKQNMCQEWVAWLFDHPVYCSPVSVLDVKTAFEC
jgi:hypothetical protein